ncbi:hypothetical protein [Aliidongia dinghuensis]|uniref:hypothetical protein n=1 Tax=Aliidongia dinghuensis TaxID=1867774 RepID=UPI00166CF1BA|nr:hypothetical protein [Aliidongia dinghuensis]
MAGLEAVNAAELFRKISKDISEANEKYNVLLRFGFFGFFGHHPDSAEIAKNKLLSHEITLEVCLAFIWLKFQPDRETVNTIHTAQDFSFMARCWWREHGVDSPKISPVAIIIACIISGRPWRQNKDGEALLAIGTRRTKAACGFYSTRGRWR